MKKYMLTNKTIKTNGRTLHRIVALRDFGDVKAGDLGGYIENEENLSHEGNCWVADDAQVFENATVFCDAQIYEEAKVYGNARVYNDAKVYGNAQVYDHADIKEDSEVYENAKVYGNAELFSMAEVCGNAQVYGNACVFGSVCDDAKVYGVCTIYEHSYIDRDAEIGGYNDYGTVNGFGPDGRSTISFFKTNSGNIRVYEIGGFDGTLEEYENETMEIKDNRFRRQNEIIIELIKSKFM